MNTNKLKGIIAEKGYTQRRLAKDTGVGLNHINDVLNNKISPRLSLVYKLCEVLEIHDIDLIVQVFFGDNVQ